MEENNTKPKRIQRKRVKGWKMPENTVSVTRPGKWGNPFTLGKIKTKEDIISEYENMIYANESLYQSIKKELKGKNLACFCKEGEACHADILLEIANN